MGVVEGGGRAVVVVGGGNDDDCGRGVVGFVVAAESCGVVRDPGVRVVVVMRSRSDQVS